WFRAEADAPSLPQNFPVWASGTYAHEAARVITAWKSGHRPDLDQPLARLGRILGRILHDHLNPTTVVVMPAPSGWRRVMTGNEVVAPWAQAITEGMRERGCQAVMAPVLRRRGGSQKRLSQGMRRERRAHSVTLRPRNLSLPPQAAVVLVDDVLTTGATLAACARAVSTQAPVLGAIVLAATPNPVIHE
ncbi:MAG TPA: phosphoribosyltransferase family protein, partial [Beutenbergiaceae bacterium]|nr:phosphoribosyltransferase family protein [Beutenbergiaceae bacterium]